MPDVKILSEKPIGMVELKNELESIKKRDKELNFRATKTEEYLQQFTMVKNSEGLVKKLEDLKIPRLKDAHITKIVDILPTTLEDLKAVLQGYSLTVNNENLNKIVETVNGFIAAK